MGTTQNTQRRTLMGVNASPQFTDAGRHVEVRDESNLAATEYDQRRRSGDFVAPSGLTDQLQVPLIQPREVPLLYSSNPTSISDDNLLMPSDVHRHANAIHIE